MRRLALLLLLSSGLLACPTDRDRGDDDDAVDDDDSAVEDDDDAVDDDDVQDDDDDVADDDDDAVDDDDSASGFVTVTGFCFDPDLGAGDKGALEGATVAEGADPDNSTVTGSDGTYELTIATGSAVELTATAPNHVDQVTLIQTSMQNNRETGVMHPVVSTTMLDQITQYGWSQAYDPSTATIWVGGWPAAVGLEVDLSADNLGAMAFGSGQPQPGNVFESGVFQLGFFGVEPGPVEIQLTGDDCFGVHEFETVAGVLYYTSVLCTP